MTSDELMTAALAEARTALDMGVFPVGAVLSLDGRIIARGHRAPGDSKIDHAETKAVREAVSAGFDVRGAVLVTTLEPCIMCIASAIHCGVSEVLFAMEDAHGGASELAHEGLHGRRYRHHQIEVHAGIGREEARMIFRSFFLEATQHSGGT